MLCPYEAMYAGLIGETLHNGINDGKTVSVFAKSFYLSGGGLPILSGRPTEIVDTVQGMLKKIKGIDMGEVITVKGSTYQLRSYAISNERPLDVLVTTGKVHLLALPELVIEATVMHTLLASHLKIPLGSLNFMLGKCFIPVDDLKYAHAYMVNAMEIGEWKHKLMPAKVTIHTKEGQPFSSYDNLMVSIDHYEPLILELAKDD